jgi:hypothetical protein
VGEAISDLIGLLPGALAIEVTLVFISAALWRLVSPVVQGALDGDILPPVVAQYIDVAFRIILPAVMMIWLLSIPVRFLWIR